MEDIKRSNMVNRRLQKSLLLGCASMALAACSSGHTVTLGGGGGTEPNVASPGGLFIANLNTSAPQVALITEAGNGWLDDASGSLLFSFSLGSSPAQTASDGSFVYNGSIVEYNRISGAALAAGTVTANVRGRSSIVLTYALSTGSSSYTLAYDASLYEQPSALSTIAGSYSAPTSKAEGASLIAALNIDANGGLTGSDSQGCTYTGTVALVDATYNAYQLNNVVETCGGASPTTISGLTGQAIISPATGTTPQNLTLSLSNETQQSSVDLSK